MAPDDWAPLRDSYLTGLLGQRQLWAYAAVVDGKLLIYDLAVRVDRQRLGIGRALIPTLLDDAAAVGIGEVWVPAAHDDTHGSEFYRRTGGAAQAVTTFTYPSG